MRIVLSGILPITQASSLITSPLGTPHHTAVAKVLFGEQRRVTHQTMQRVLERLMPPRIVLREEMRRLKFFCQMNMLQVRDWVAHAVGTAPGPFKQRDTIGFKTLPEQPWTPHYTNSCTPALLPVTGQIDPAHAPVNPSLDPEFKGNFIFTVTVASQSGIFNKVNRTLRETAMFSDFNQQHCEQRHCDQQHRLKVSYIITSPLLISLYTNKCTRRTSYKLDKPIANSPPGRCSGPTSAAENQQLGAALREPPTLFVAMTKEQKRGALWQLDLPLVVPTQSQVRHSMKQIKNGRRCAQFLRKCFSSVICSSGDGALELLRAAVT